MKNYYIGALAMAAVGCIAYIFLKMAAAAERGYDAIGGEVCVFMLAIVIAAAIIQTGMERRYKDENDE